MGSWQPATARDRTDVLWGEAADLADQPELARAGDSLSAVAGAAKAAQVLRPGGRPAVFWNVDQPPPEVTDALAAVYQRLVPDAPFNLQPTKQALDGYQVLFAKAADGIRQVGGLADPERWRFDSERSSTREQWLDQLVTSGALSRLPSDALAQVLEGVGAAIDAMGAASPCPPPRWRSPRHEPAPPDPAR